MAMDFLDRLVLAASLIALGITAWLILNRWILWRASKNGRQLKKLQMPTILYFTTPTCAPCKTYQRPALEQVKKAVGDRLHVIEIDASAQPELASRWGVLSVPTTMILDPVGNARHVNHGPTSAAKLLHQLNLD